MTLDSVPLEPAPPSDRFVALEQVFNFRDLGGLTTTSGRTVRRGLVFRSDQFGNACPADIDHLVDTVALRTVVDLRSAEEIKETGSFPSDRGVRVAHVPLRHLPWERFDQWFEEHESAAGFLTQRYTAMLETGADEVRQVLELMCEETPLAFHCMAGKDRTGIVAAVALGLLGVDRDDITTDFALTLYGMTRFRAWCEANDRGLARWGLRPEAEAMSGLLDNLDASFGSFEGYARAIGFTDVDALRARLLA
ncbi:tyrosine-protein phosphatase [Stackebrandtia soli]|uniref:tyrosine-protein phosphatase n=1 Tax=Stackebrandtia soli TaxID=1892856 RepID=UPI0039E78DFE